MMVPWLRATGKGAAVAAFGMVLGMAACGEALRLEPPSGSSGSVNPSGGGNAAGGGAPVACESNSDCPAPTSVCDTAKALCVECLVFNDCGAQEGTVCSQGQCVCPDDGTWCGPNNCVDLSADSDNCGACNHGCFGACVDSQCADAWEPLPTTGAPSPRSRHVALWTGTHMIIWGGTSDASVNNNLNTGAMYDPASFEWTTLSTVDAPSPRQNATAVWTGSQMIVWGGRDGSTFLDDGAVFTPATNSWLPMDQASAPSGRDMHVAVWADNVGSMVVWGGRDASDELNSGGLYNPASGWTPTAALPTPAASRRNHSAVWNGSEMIIYGGIGDSVALALVDTYWPSGSVPGGRIYNPLANSWDVIPSDPPAVAMHTAVWTGTAMLLFGGNSGGGQLDSGFKFENSLWSAFSGTPPEARSNHTAVWLDTQAVMLVWGGQGASGRLNSGASYNPVTNSWDVMSLPTVLEARIEHTAVSTGDSMIIWGGANAADVRLNTGAIYRP